MKICWISPFGFCWTFPLTRAWETRWYKLVFFPSLLHCLVGFVLNITFNIGTINNIALVLQCFEGLYLCVFDSSLLVLANSLVFLVKEMIIQNCAARQFQVTFIVTPECTINIPFRVICTLILWMSVNALSEPAGNNIFAPASTGVGGL